MNNLDVKFSNLENRLNALERFNKVDVGQCFPIGAIYATISGAVGYNPATFVGFGTWSYCGKVEADDGGSPCDVHFWERTA